MSDYTTVKQVPTFSGSTDTMSIALRMRGVERKDKSHDDTTTCTVPWCDHSGTIQQLKVHFKDEHLVKGLSNLYD